MIIIIIDTAIATNRLRMDVSMGHVGIVSTSSLVTSTFSTVVKRLKASFNSDIDSELFTLEFFNILEAKGL